MGEEAKAKSEWPMGCEGHPASLVLLVFRKFKRVKVSLKTNKLSKQEKERPKSKDTQQS